MDSLTQIVLGAAVGEAAIGKKIGNKAILWGAIAGTIPDLDVLTKLWYDDVTANELHRGFSHSILFSIVAAPILGYLVAKHYKNKEADWKDWTKLMFLGLFTHPLLDAFTTWGTQLFWPLSNRISFHNIFVVDPLYTLPFLSCLIVAMCHKRADPKRKRWNTAGITISSIYMGITLLFKGVTYQKFQNSLFKQQIPYLAIQTKPTPLNSILWTANVETNTSFLIGYYSLLDTDDTIDFEEFPKNHHLLGTLENDPLITRLIVLSQGWYTIEKIKDKIFFNDLRFGKMGIHKESSPFVFSYELYSKNDRLHAKERERKITEVKPVLKALFARVLGHK